MRREFSGHSTPPVVLFSFNRPDSTQRVLDAIRLAAPRRLFLVCDGARAGRAEDQERCEAVRSVLERIDWECDVDRIYHTVNRGCTPSVELGLDRVFDRVSEAVVLEDDCVPDPSFFPYCAELLRRYRDDPSIHHIGGFALDTPRELFGGASYAPSTLAVAWGWATWADRWQAHRRRFPRDWTAGSNGILPHTAKLTPEAFSTISGGLRTEYAYRARLASTATLPWDNLVGLSVSNAGGCVITPAVNMVENIGFGPDATHNVGQTTLPSSTAMTFPLVHADVATNTAVALELEFDGLWFPVGRRIRRIRRRIPVGRTRTGLLRLATSTPVIVARAWLWRARNGAGRLFKRRSNDDRLLPTLQEPR